MRWLLELQCELSVWVKQSEAEKGGSCKNFGGIHNNAIWTESRAISGSHAANFFMLLLRDGKYRQ